MKKIAWLVAAVMLLSCLVACNPKASNSQLENSFTTVSVSGGVKIISYTGNYTTLEIPSTIGGKNVVEIGDNVFKQNYLLTEIVIPDTVKKIGNRAFQACFALESIVIPDSVTFIGDYAFFGCWAAKSLHIGAGLESMGEQAIQYCKSLETITVSEDNDKFAASDDGVLFTGNYNTLICYPAASSMTSYTVPNNCIAIEDYAFRNCVNLETLVIGDHVNDIGDSTFLACEALKNVTLGSGIDSIGQFTFSDCTALEEIVIPEGVTAIGYLMEEGECGSSFDGCTSLKKIVLPASLTNIYANSFSQCSALTEIAFCGSEAAWKNVVIGEGNDAIGAAKITYNYSVN